VRLKIAPRLSKVRFYSRTPVLDVLTEGLRSQRLNPELKPLLDQLNSTRSQMGALVFKGPGQLTAEKYQEMRARLDEKRQTLESSLSSRVAEVRAQSRPVTIELVQQVIPEDAALVEMVLYQPFDLKAAKPGDRWGEPRYAAYLLKRTGEPMWVDIGRAAAVDDAVNGLLGELRNSRSADVRRRARVVDQMVMQPIRRLLNGTRKVLMSPEGQLNRLPFGALVDEKGRYLLEQYSFIYLTSGRDLLRLQDQAASKGRAIILANPAYDADGVPSKVANGVGQSAIKLSGFKVEALSGTAEEGERLAGILSGAELLTGPDATEAAIKRAHAPIILHIATYGFFLPVKRLPLQQGTRAGATESAGGPPNMEREENPLLRSGIALAGFNKGQSGDDDGVLTALEAAGLDLWGTQLVVMSACETGLGDVFNGEGVYGLRRALVIAGAESQVISLWKIDDQITRDLIISFYRRLLAGEGRNDAPRHVQLEMIKSRDRKQPYYWAGFLQSGQWEKLRDR
jgi:CHAT domain-containing protein